MIDDTAATMSLPVSETPAVAGVSQWRFVVTICAGSFLLFLVQPMVARMALPRLGGAPAVWNSAMLVYQALLLGGYGYAHWLGRFAPRRQAAIHLLLFVAAATMLPIGLIAGAPSATANPFLWVPWLFATSIGPLFFMVSAQAPLVQRWFSASGGDNPYRLYAASNLGSFAGLVAYPLVVEPLLPLKGQSWLWSAGYVLVLVLTGVCALQLPRGVRTTSATPVAERPSWRQMARWAGLAAIPSGLMLSTSTHLTTDIVAMPLLWVLPLGLYLLSFSVAFAERRGLATAITAVMPLLLLGGGGTSFVNTSQATILFALVGLILLFAVSVALHAKLYDERPAAEQLTAFYLAMSAGGVIGGIFCALVAPLVFDWVYEHPILIVAAALALPQRPLFGFSGRLWAGPYRRIARLAVIGVSLTIGLFVPALTGNLGVAFVLALVVIELGLIAIGERTVFAVCLVALMLTLGGRTTLQESLLVGDRTRSFFGVYAVGTDNRPARLLVHGTTLHGLQSLTPGREHDALSYYAPRSGVGLTLSHLPELYADARVGIVGLGAGTVACYSRPGQDWRFYEIDPAVEKIARNPKYFTFLSGCAPRVPVLIGDARVVLEREPAAGLDVLVIDAFSSDAVPMHLLTREAMDIYRRRLAPNGVLLMHISNRYLELEPVLATAEAHGWHGMVRHYRIDEVGAKRGDSSSIWVALSPDPAALGKLVATTGADNWRPMRPRPGFAGWTDDHASILPLLTLTGPK